MLCVSQNQCYSGIASISEEYGSISAYVRRATLVRKRQDPISIVMCCRQQTRDAQHIYATRII